MPATNVQSPVQYDVFNGDADGICALHQLRLARPAADAHLVTGVKRDIALLDKIRTVRGARITVLDVSLDTNRTSLLDLLGAGNEIVYIDHHFAGAIPESGNLTAHIDPAPEQCTALIVDQLLNGAFRRWAICGAFGDNLHASATTAAAAAGLSVQQTEQLREVGELLNYNGYGNTLTDLYFPPDQLYRSISQYRDPFEYYEQSLSLKTLRTGFANDMALAEEQPVYATHGLNRVFRLPDSPWSRRVSGVFANRKATENPNGAHALITENSDGTLRISVRAPLADRRDADTLCRSFPTGGGRAGAAGINALAEDRLAEFVTSFNRMYT